MPNDPKLTETTFKNSTVTWSLLIFVLVTGGAIGLYFTDYIADVRADYRGRIERMETDHKVDKEKALEDLRLRMESDRELALIIQQMDNDRARNDRRITRDQEDIQTLYQLVDELTRKQLTEHTSGE